MNLVLGWLIENYYELIASTAGFIGVWLTARQNIWCWLVGLINVVFSAIVFFNSKLYADFVLQFFYFYVTVFGWYKWYKGSDNGKKLRVSRIKIRSFAIIIIVFVISAFVTAYIFDNYTDANLPYLNSITAVGGVICTYLAAKKIIENWLFWIFIDSLAVSIYIYLSLYAFAVLFFTYCILAIYGYLQWKKSLISS